MCFFTMKLPLNGVCRFSTVVNRLFIFFPKNFPKPLPEARNYAALHIILCFPLTYIA